MDRILVTRLLATTASIAWLAVNAPVHAQSPQVPTVAAGSIAGMFINFALSRRFVFRPAASSEQAASMKNS
jgi:putative flippase GtrA